MKRTTIVSLFLFSLLLWPGQRSACAQQKTMQKEEPAQEEGAKSPRWEKVHSLEVLKVWELHGRKWPQVTIVRISNANYIKFLQDPKAFMEFVNKNKFFTKDVIKAGPWVSLSSVDEERPDPNCWILTLMHGKASSLIVSALPELPGDNKADNLPPCE